MKWNCVFFFLCAYRVTADATTQFPQLRQSLESLNNGTGQSTNGATSCNIASFDGYSGTSPRNARETTREGPLQATAAIALAVEHLNAGDGTVIRELEGLNQRCSVRFSAEFFDSGMSAAGTVDQLFSITERTDIRRPCAVLDAGPSTVSTAAATITGLKGLPHLSWQATSTKLSDREQFPLFARLTSTKESLAAAQVEHIYQTLGVRYWALVYSESNYIVNEISAIQATASTMYPDLVIEPIPYTGDMTESTATAVVAAVRKSMMMYVYAAIPGDDVEALMLEAYHQGISDTHVWTFRDERRTANRSAQRNGFASDDPLLSALAGSLRVEEVIGSPGVARYDAFVETWKAIGTNGNDTVFLDSMLPKSPSRSAFQPSTFENIGDELALAYDAAVLMGLAACEASNTQFTGQGMYDSMVGISFVGATGTVAIDPKTKTRARNAVMYRLLSLVIQPLDNGNFTLSETEVGLYNGTQWNLTSEIIFSTEDTAAPPDLAPLNENLNAIDVRTRLFSLVMSVVVVLLSAAMSLWTAVNAKSARVIRAAQPFFLHLICVGTALMGVSIIPLSLDDSFAGKAKADASCIAFPWLLALGWAVSFSALFSKTMRVNRLFHNPSFRRLTVTVSDVMKPMALLLCANVVILLLWSTLSPLQFERMVLDYDDFGRDTESVGSCRSGQFWWFFLPLALLNFAALVVANQQAYVARKLSTEFAESDSIARAMSWIFIVALLVVPLDMLSGADPNVHLFISVTFVSTVALSLLLHMFVPKIAYLGREGDRSLKDSIRGSLSKSKSPDSFKPEPQFHRNPSSATEDGELVLLHPKLAAADEAANQCLRLKIGQQEERIHRLRHCVVGLGGTPDDKHLEGGDLDPTIMSQGTMSD